MSGVKPETRLRHMLAGSMRNRWQLTWHEDREIGPGVPDASYVMFGMGHTYQTGWLELKAPSPDRKFQVKIEPSQHQWIMDHLPLKVPVGFLILWDGFVYYISGKYHQELANSKHDEDLARWCDFQASEHSFAQGLADHLRMITQI